MATYTRNPHMVAHDPDGMTATITVYTADGWNEPEKIRISFQACDEARAIMRHRKYYQHRPLEALERVLGWGASGLWLGKTQIVSVANPAWFAPDDGE